MNTNDFLEKMKSLLDGDPDAKIQFDDIYEPRSVAVVPEDAWRSLLVTKDGYIRYYGRYFDGRKEEYPECYIESRDCGVSWRTRFPKNKTAIGASAYVPFLDKYCAMRSAEGKGTFFYAADSPDDTPTCVKVCDEEYIDFRLPFTLKSRNRIIVVTHERRPGEHPTCFYAVLFISDDGGKTFRKITPEIAPYYSRASENEGIRWQQNNRENSIEELTDGTLMMMSRTATDYHYVTYSKDGGDTWDKIRPSVFHSTGTMPFLKKLSDGRLLFFWCNTNLLPELPEADGIWEDVFTNRDASHCAVSEDDGKTWIGLREFRLNNFRNCPDFRARGGVSLYDGADKSVHQFEVIELPYDKVLVVSGQNKILRRATIFDIKWLYEKSREEDFLLGLGNISSQVYIKSVLGGYRLGCAGHCAYNRLPSAVMMPNPNVKWRETMYLTYLDDDRLVSGVAGAVWNFPAAKKGKVVVRAKINGQPLRVTLLDHWLNPCDQTLANNQSAIVMEKVDADDFFDYVFSFDTENRVVSVVLPNGKTESRPLPILPTGISYLHLQIAATDNAEVGVYVSHLSFKAE